MYSINKLRIVHGNEGWILYLTEASFESCFSLLLVEPPMSPLASLCVELVTSNPSSVRMIEDMKDCKHIHVVPR